MAEGTKRTHEEFLHRTREVVIARALELGTINDDEAARLEHAKLLYGIGDGSYRGVCHYQAWENGIGKVDVIEVAATAEESWVQLAGTTTHELGHVLAGWEAGHGANWKTACERLGLRRSAAAGQIYRLAQLDRKVRTEVYAIAQDLADGSPSFKTFGLGAGGFGWGLPTGFKVTIRPCSAGVGTRGGKSRGTGSGSRMVKVECSECGYVARVSRKWLEDKGAPRCGDEDHGRMVEPEGESSPASAAPVDPTAQELRREAEALEFAGLYAQAAKKYEAADEWNRLDDVIAKERD
jgi:hypothetical protein